MQFSSLRLTVLAAGVIFTPLTWTPNAAAQTAPLPVTAKPFLHTLFTDNAVLQRDRAIPVWGWTTPGAKVQVKMDEKLVTGRADASGRWMIKIGPYPAGGPHSMTVTGASPAENVIRQNILFGDVWLCSGQSNMEMGIRGANNGAEEIAKANYPQIRLYTVPQKTALTPQTGLDAQWLICTPENIQKNSQGGVQGGNLGFSAVGYFFGRKLNQELGVPIGLIQSAWGGTIIEAWISESALGMVPDFKAPLTARKLANAQSNMTYEARLEAWTRANDPGYDAKWTSPGTQDSKWSSIKVPTKWEQSGALEFANFDGLAQFRREVIVPDSWAGHDLTLSLGGLDDNDVTYWNGTVIGASNGASKPRTYSVPGAQVKAGRAVIAMRILDTGGPGGFDGPAAAMKLSLDGANSIPLDGDWKATTSVPLSKMGTMPVVDDPNNPNRIDVLYNGMIAPLVPYGMKGAIWYQGESNAERPEQYGRLLPTLVDDWRARFGLNMSFHVVQLAGFRAPDEEPKDEPRNDDWTLLRAAQQHTVDTLPNMTLAVATDIGDQNDIHPRDKQDVGLRLALGALAKDYGKPVEYTGPVLKSATPKDGQIALEFTHADGGLSIKGDVSRAFAIAGADRVWAWASPQIEGSQITLSSPAVPKPVYARYAWQNLPQATLYNGAALPAPPFRTTP